MTTPDPQRARFEARLITADEYRFPDTLPAPAWYFIPGTGGFGPHKWVRRVVPFDRLALIVATHYHPDQPTAPTCAPGAGTDLIGGFRITPKGFQMNEPLPPTKEATAAYRAEEAADIAASRATSLPPAETGTADAKQFRGAFPVRAGHCKADQVVVLESQFNAVADKVAALERERDEARAELAQLQRHYDLNILSWKEQTAALAAARAERDHLLAYVGNEQFMSDFQTAADMRKALNEARAEVGRLKAEEAASYEQFPCRMTKKAYLANAKERDDLRAQLTTLRAQADAMAGAVETVARLRPSIRAWAVSNQIPGWQTEDDLFHAIEKELSAYRAAKKEGV